MKARISAFVLALCVFPMLTLGIGGCQTGGPTSPKAKTFLTLKQTQDVVHSMMQQYGALVRAGQVSAERQRSIDAAHERYRQAFDTAAQLARVDLSTATPEELDTIAKELVSLISQIIPPKSPATMTPTPTAPERP